MIYKIIIFLFFAVLLLGNFSNFSNANNVPHVRYDGFYNFTIFLEGSSGNIEDSEKIVGYFIITGDRIQNANLGLIGDVTRNGGLSLKFTKISNLDCSSFVLFSGNRYTGIEKSTEFFKCSEPGEYELQIFGKLEVQNMNYCPTQLCVSSDIFKFWPPKKQIDFGIEPELVFCNGALELIFKTSDGNPACVKHETAMKLVERGWIWTIYI